jgi:hypothetical protein
MVRHQQGELGNDIVGVNKMIVPGQVHRVVETAQRYNSVGVMTDEMRYHGKGGCCGG